MPNQASWRSRTRLTLIRYFLSSPFNPSLAMKTKLFTIALLLATVVGSTFVAAQSITGTTVPTAGSTPPEGTGRGGMRGGRGGQPRMELALLSLQEARRSLDGAVHDKGGNRDKAIASVDKAIEDVKAGIEYARTHPEEFGRGGRRGAGAPPTGTSAAPTGTST